MIGIIAACSINGVIGITENGKGTIPFKYTEDMKHFKKMTMNSVVIMGRKTFESIGKPLPKRENIIISSREIQIPDVKVYHSIKSAISDYSKRQMNIWFIGGFDVYREGMFYTNEIHLTITPDYIEHANPVYFPWINPAMFEFIGCTENEESNDRLMFALYKRKKAIGYHEKIISKIAF